VLPGDLAVRLAELAAGWLRKRPPEAWFSLAIVVSREDGRHVVLPRGAAVEALETARGLALARGHHDAADELARGIDLVKAAAPVEVPLAIVLEREAALEVGVVLLRLPVDELHAARARVAARAPRRPR
jgi:hypothetical protein